MKPGRFSKLEEYTSSILQENEDAAGEFPDESGYSGAPGAFSNAIGLLLVTIMLTAFGLMMIYSATSHFSKETVLLFRNQFTWVIIGCVCGITAFFMGHKLLGKLSYWLLGGCAVLLLWARCCREINGAYRWIQFGGFTFQPSEMAKIAVIIFVSWFCSENIRTFDRWDRKRNGIIHLAGVVGIILGLILLGHDLGTTTLVGTVAFFIAFVAGLHWWYWVIPSAVAALGIIYLKFFDAMRWARMTIFFDPEKQQLGKGMQLWFSFLALGSGHWTGVGLTKSRFKADYLPEKQTDFILSIVGEELGFIGIVAVLILYTLWGFFAVRIALKAKDRCGMLMAWGLTIGVMLQAAINFGAMSGCFPTKGMPAPFISYGGSNLLGCFIATGILTAIAAYTENPGYRNFFRKKNQDDEAGDY